MIKGQIETEQEKKPGSAGGIDSAVLLHGAVDPVASTGIPENSAKVSEKKSLNWGRR